VALGRLLHTEIIVSPQFRGPPNSGNGGYVCGLMASVLGGPTTGVLRAPVPLDTPLRLTAEAGSVRLTSLAGDLIGEARGAEAASLPIPPPAPSHAAANAAGHRFVGLQRRFHPVCFTCGDKQAEGFGLRVFTGQVEGAADGVVAGVWTPHAAFADAQGLARTEVVWAALDCPGSVAWVERGGSGGLLGTMSGAVLRRPATGEPCIVLAWPIEASGRKSISGVALYSADGELLAHGHQVWIAWARAA